MTFARNDFSNDARARSVGKTKLQSCWFANVRPTVDNSVFLIVYRVYCSEMYIERNLTRTYNFATPF